MESEEKIVAKLNDSIIWAKYDYLQHKRIFLDRDKELHTKIIKATAPDFFSHLNGLLWDRMILSISKLTDKYKQGKNKSLSMDYLVFVSSTRKMKCSQEMSGLFQECLDHASGVRKYRSKVVAHRDLSSAFYSKLTVQIGEVEKAFSVIEKMMNTYHLEKSGTSWIFDLGGMHDAGSLFYHLEQALIYETLTESRKDRRADLLEEQAWKKIF